MINEETNVYNMIVNVKISLSVIQAEKKHQDFVSGIEKFDKTGLQHAQTHESDALSKSRSNSAAHYLVTSVEPV